jgi:hypothetical protein
VHAKVYRTIYRFADCTGMYWRAHTTGEGEKVVGLYVNKKKYLLGHAAFPGTHGVHSNVYRYTALFIGLRNARGCTSARTRQGKGGRKWSVGRYVSKQKK